MGLLDQIVTGTALLGVCSILHVILVGVSVANLQHIGRRIQTYRVSIRLPIFVGMAFSMVVLSHTIQVWMWSAAFIWRDALPDWSTSVYFSMITYTTLGYGDVILAPDNRIFAAFAAFTGLLNFGVSTAFLVTLVTKVLGVQFSDPHSDGS
jgi:hypothetical protein